MRPLDGVTVVSIEQAVAAPFASRHLADLGARVIKIERPTGDFARVYDETVHGLSAAFVWLNRSKESVVLDLKHSQANEVIDRLLSKADVFIQNLAPGAAGRLGLSSENLLAAHPRLVICEISGYGDSGPYRDKKAYDLLIQAESGLITTTGTPDNLAKTGISIADIAAGIYAYSGILSALYQRERTGKGSIVKVSMFEALCEWMVFPLYYSHFGGMPYIPTGASHPAIYPYGPFPVGDGKTLVIGIQNQREWKSFCECVLMQPEMADDVRFNSNSRRVANRDILKEVIEGSFSKYTLEQLTKLLDSFGIANAQMNELEGVWNHPQLAARERWRNVDSPVGPIPALLHPAVPQGSEPRMDPIPSLGQHTDSVLSEFGYNRDDIDQLREEQVIA
jgi:itaconate CoA-transferase